MKAAEQYVLVVLFMVLCKMVLTFDRARTSEKGAGGGGGGYILPQKILKSRVLKCYFQHPS